MSEKTSRGLRKGYRLLSRLIPHRANNLQKGIYPDMSQPEKVIYRANKEPCSKKFSDIEELFKKKALLSQAGMAEHPLIKASLFWSSLEQSSRFFDIVQGKGKAFELTAYHKVLDDELNRSLNPFYPHPKESDFKGDIPIAYLLNGGLFKLSLEDYQKHTLNIGESGSGKSNNSKVQIISLKHTHPEIKIWVFCRRQEYRSLINVFPTFKVLRLKDYYDNPLEPPCEMDKIHWASIVGEVLGSETYLLSSSKNIFLHCVKEFYRQNNRTPVLTVDIPQMLSKTKSKYFRQNESISSIQNRLQSLYDTGCFNVKSGYPISELLNHDIIFEFESPFTELQNFMTTMLFTKVFYYKVHHRNEFKNIFIIEEARKLFSSNRDFNTQFGNSIGIDLFAQFRGKAAFEINMQEPSSISNTIKSNVFIQFLFKLSSGVEILEMQRSMGLTNEQVDFYRTLPIGTAIARYGDYPHPFIVSFPKFPDTTYVTNDELDIRMRDFLASLPVTKISQENIIEVIQEISPELKLLLNEIYLNRKLSTTEHYAMLNIPKSSGDKLKKDALSQGLIGEFLTRISQRGGMASILYLMPAGYNTLKLQPRLTARGDDKHNWWILNILEFYKNKGYEVNHEYFINSKYLDVYAANNEEKIGIEVCINKSNLDTYIEKSLFVNRLILCFETVEEIKSTKKLNKELKNVEFLPLYNFY